MAKLQNFFVPCTSHSLCNYCLFVLEWYFENKMWLKTNQKRPKKGSQKQNGPFLLCMFLWNCNLVFVQSHLPLFDSLLTLACWNILEMAQNYKLTGAMSHRWHILLSRFHLQSYQLTNLHMMSTLHIQSSKYRQSLKGWPKSTFEISLGYGSENMHFRPMLVKPKCVWEASISFESCEQTAEKL